MKEYTIFEFHSVSKDGYEVNASVTVKWPLLLLVGALVALYVAWPYLPI